MNYLQRPMSNSILIFCEAISYGHKARTLLLANWLKSIAGNTILIACPEQISALFAREGFKTVNINMINPVKIYQRLRKGEMMYEKADLLQYFEQDDRLIQDVNPKLIVSDFRFTALQLAKKKGIPSVGITDAPCHPHFVTDGSLPDIITQPAWIPLKIFEWIAASSLGKKINQQVIARVSLTLREASMVYGTEVLPTFFDYASQGDICLFCDHPALIPINPLRPGDFYTGALLWERSEPLPSVLSQLDPSKKTIYVSLGTQESLPTDFLEDYIQQLLSENLQVIISLGRRPVRLSIKHDNLFVFEFVNDSKLLALVDLMVFPGGQMTTYQALALGVPLIVLPAHANQHFYAEAVVRNQFGYLFHPSRLKVNKLVKATLRLLGDDPIEKSIHSFQQKLATFNNREMILRCIEGLL